MVLFHDQRELIGILETCLLAPLHALINWIMVLKEEDEDYYYELIQYESKLEYIYDISSYKLHTIYYSDTDYLLTKIGALLSLYTKIAQVTIFVVFNRMFWKHILKKMNDKLIAN